MTAPVHQDPLIVLFNYGGGLRGVIQAHIMAKIEQDTGYRMADMVDVFSGPSTGAILNAALTLRSPDDPSQPKYRARHLVRFYEREGERIFPPDRFRSLRGLVHDFNNRTMRIGQLNTLFRHGHYNPAHLGRALKALYGDARLADSLQSLIIPSYNIDGEQLRVVTESGETPESPVHTKNNFMDTGGHALWLKNLKFPQRYGVRSKTPDVLLYDAVMASTAAPTFFPCHHFSVKWPDHARAHHYSAIDGSIFDNPSTTYLGALRQHLPADRPVIMLGLGTGYTNRSIKRDEWNRYGSLGVVDPVNDLPLINIFFHAAESALLDAFAQEINGHLFLFNKSLVSDRSDETPSTQIDDGSPENMRRLRHFAQSIVEENQKSYETVCDLLTRHADKKHTLGSENRPSPWRKVFSYFKKEE